MTGVLNRLVIRVSGSGWLYAATLAIFALSLLALLRIGNSFAAAAGGLQPFDMQNEITAAEVLAQLPAYAGEAGRLYWLFTAVDYVFPLAAALFLAATAAFCLRRSFPQVYSAMASRGLLPVFMIGGLFDWAENLSALAAILTYPDTAPALATTLVVAKRAKLTLVIATQMLVLLLLVATVVIGRVRDPGIPEEAEHR